MLVEYATAAKQLGMAVVGFAQRNLFSSCFVVTRKGRAVFPDEGLATARRPTKGFRQFAGSARPCPEHASRFSQRIQSQVSRITIWRAYDEAVRVICHNGCDELSETVCSHQPGRASTHHRELHDA